MGLLIILVTHFKKEQWQSRAHSDTDEEGRKTVFQEQAGRRLEGREKPDHSLRTSEGCHVEEHTELFFYSTWKRGKEGEATERQTFVTQKHTRSNKLELHENETGDTELPVAGRIQENQMPIAKGAYSKMDQSKRREIDSLSFI